MMTDEVKQFLARNRGRIIGALAGLIIAMLIIHYGFFRALFICAMVAIGYIIGKRLDDEQSGLSDLLDRFLPNGQR